MFKVLNLSKRIWVFWISLISLFTISILFLFTYPVEQSFYTQVKVSKDNSAQLIVDSSVIYKLKSSSNIVLSYNEKYYKFDILYVEIVENTFLVTIETEKSELIPGSTLDSRLIYNKTSVFKIIFDYFK